jgi:excisionase family DNA binding protein
MRKTIDEPLHGLQWLSEYLGFEDPIPLKTIYNWRQRGEVPPAYRVGKYLRYRKSDVDAWLEGRRDNAEKLAG